MPITSYTKTTLPKKIYFWQTRRPTINEYFDVKIPIQKNISQMQFQVHEPKNCTSSLIKRERNSLKEENIKDNVPLKGLKLIGIERQRTSQSSKDFFEVLIPDYNLVVPLQPDIFFESILQDGFNQATKELNSEFIFVSINGLTKLIRIGSELHEAILEKEKLKNKPSLNIKTMNVGEVFRTSSGRKAIFLGFVNYKYLSLDQKKKNNDSNENIVINDNIVNIEELKESKCKLATLWFDHKYGDLTSGFERFLKNMKDYNIYNIGYNVALRKGKTHPYVEKVKDIKFEVSDNLILQIRNNARNRFREDLKRYKNEQATYQINLNKYAIKILLSSFNLANITIFGIAPEIDSELLRELHQIIEENNSFHTRPKQTPGTSVEEKLRHLLCQKKQTEHGKLVLGAKNLFVK